MPSSAASAAMRRGFWAKLKVSSPMLIWKCLAMWRRPSTAPTAWPIAAAPRRARAGGRQVGADRRANFSSALAGIDLHHSRQYACFGLGCANLGPGAAVAATCDLADFGERVGAAVFERMRGAQFAGERQPDGEPIDGDDRIAARDQRRHQAGEPDPADPVNRDR